MSYILFAMMVLWPPEHVNGPYKHAQMITQEFNGLDECKAAAYAMEHDEFCYVEICGEMRRVCYITNAKCLPKGQLK